MIEDILAILTDATCGAACWHAREEVCRCSCGGKNHGILKCEGAEQPTRTCKMDGERYELVAVGRYRELYTQATEMLKGLPERTSKYVTYTFPWSTSEKGSPIRLKYATPQQCEGWKELSAYKGLTKQELYQQNPSLLWKKI